MTWKDLGITKMGVWFTFTCPFTIIFLIPNVILSCFDRRDVICRSIEWSHSFLPGHRWKPMLISYQQCTFCGATRRKPKEVK